MNEVPIEIRRAIVEQKKQMWRNTLYDAGLDAKIAEALGDQAMKQQATQRMKNALKAIDLLEKILEGGE